VVRLRVLGHKPFLNKAGQVPVNLGGVFLGFVGNRGQASGTAQPRQRFENRQASFGGLNALTPMTCR
jgi:hypothetical protein